MATTAIAILNYNGKEFLEKFLPTFVQYSNNTPIYIGDNASNDESVNFIKEQYPLVRIIELDQNYGYSKGYNLLIKEIKEDYIAIVNSDIEVTPNWLNPLVECLHTNTDVAAVQPKIKSYSAKDSFEYAGGAGGFIDTYGYPFCRGRVFNTLEIDSGQYDDSIDIKWASGACFLVRKTAFDEVEGFDDDFFAHMEEIDLCWRLSYQSYVIKYVAQSQVYHVGGGTLSYESPFKTYLNFRNGLYLLLKNLPKAELRQKLIIRILLDWLSAFYYLVQGKWKLSIAIFKAHIEVLKNGTRFGKKRDSKNKKNTFTKNYSIVWNYYLKGKKKYSEL